MAGKRKLQWEWLMRELSIIQWKSWMVRCSWCHQHADYSWDPTLPSWALGCIIVAWSLQWSQVDCCISRHYSYSCMTNSRQRREILLRWGLFLKKKKVLPELPGQIILHLPVLQPVAVRSRDPWLSQGRQTREPNKFLLGSIKRKRESLLARHQRCFLLYECLQFSLVFVFGNYIVKSNKIMPLYSWK